MTGAVIAWRNLVDLPALGSPWTLDDADAAPGVADSYYNLLSPIRRRRWIGPGAAIDGGDNSLRFAWSTTSAGSRSIRLLALLDASFTAGAAGVGMYYVNSSGSTVLATTYSGEGNFHELEPRHWISVLSSRADARGIELQWNDGATADGTVGGSRLWASDALVVSHGFNARTISDEWRTSGDDVMTRGQTLTRDATARVLRRVRVTLDSSAIDREALAGDVTSRDAPFLLDLAGRGIGSDVLIMPTSSGSPVVVDRRRALYGTISSAVRIRPRPGGRYAVDFTVDEL